MTPYFSLSRKLGRETAAPTRPKLIPTMPIGPAELYPTRVQTTNEKDHSLQRQETLLKHGRESTRPPTCSYPHPKASQIKLIAALTLGMVLNRPSRPNMSLLLPPTRTATTVSLPEQRTFRMATRSIGPLASHLVPLAKSLLMEVVEALACLPSNSMLLRPHTRISFPGEELAMVMATRHTLVPLALDRTLLPPYEVVNK